MVISKLAKFDGYLHVIVEEVHSDVMQQIDAAHYRTVALHAAETRLQRKAVFKIG
jgi:hypothetical protein